MKFLLGALLTALSFAASAQFGVAYHQSNIPFGAINYELAKRLRPEIRIGTDTFFDQLTLEGVLTFDIVNKKDYEFYVGAGAKTNEFEGIVVPVGINFYPLETKNFGLHIELAPIFSDDEILRGSWGIRYRFFE